MALPTTAKGDNGPGLDEGAVAGLLAQVGRIPNGDVTQLGKAKDAWQAFADHPTTTGAADRIKGINAAFTGSTDPNITDIEAKLTTLTHAAEMLARASKALGTPVGERRDALADMRDDIQAAVATAGKEITGAIVITAGIVAIAAFASAGLAAPAAAGGVVVVTAEIVTTTAGINKNAVTISRLLIIFGSVVAVGTASGAFTAIPDLTANGINAALASIAAMSVRIADDGPGKEGTNNDGGSGEGGDTGSSGTQWDKAAGDKPSPEKVAITLPRQIHILDGDGTDNSGGHAPGTGMPNKTEFPEGWEDEKIISRIEDVARNPDQPPVLQDNGRWLVKGTRYGVDIEVVVNSDGSIWTGFPTGGVGVARNDENGDPIK
ncbi:EndoU domain-containing protein [Nocardia rhamnosiphila]